MGIGWLSDKATAAQFIQVGAGCVSAFAGIVIGIIKARKEEKTGKKEKALVFLQWLCIGGALLVAVLGLYRTF